MAAESPNCGRSPRPTVVRTGRSRRVRASGDPAVTCLTAIAVAAGTIAGVCAAPTQSADDVLARAAAYVAAYEQDLGSVIADERYRQDVSFPAVDDPTGMAARMIGNPVRRRELTSEFLLLRASGPHGPWLGLRDILRVDGLPAPDRAPLQPRLGREPDMSDVEFDRLVNESARYNIGRVRRNVNVPTFALTMVRASAQSRFTFAKREERRLAGVLTWALAFDERVRPTLIRGSAGADLPATGIISIDPASGRVIETQFSTDEPSTQVRTQVTVKYRSNRKLGIWVPIEMRERYHVRPATGFAEQIIECVATYSNFRRFEVDVRLRVP